MKDETANNGQSVMLSLSSSLESSLGRKYGDLIEESLIKRTRNELYKLFAFVYASCPNFTNATTFILLIKMLQVIGPCFLIGYNDIWSTNQRTEKIIDYLPTIYHFLPIKFRDEYFRISMIIFILINLVVYLIVIIAARIFRLQSQLPKFLANSIAFYFLSFSEFLHVIASQFIFENLSALVFKGIYNQTDMILSFCALMIIVFHVFIVIQISSQSLVFRPTSLMGVSIIPQNLVFLLTPLLNAVLAFGFDSSGYSEIAILTFGVILLIAIHLSSFLYGGFAKVEDSLIVLATSTSSIFTIVFLYSTRKKDISPVLTLFAVFLVWIIAYVLWSMVLRKNENKYLSILDTISESSIDLTLFESTHEFLSIINSGFRVSHPYCLNWKIFRVGIEKWPLDVNIWYSFAKFVAVYPEENQVLAWIFNSVTKQKLSGNAARSIKLQSLAIANERELHLTPSLKIKINLLMKQIASSKHKLRYVWDIIIQGNTRDVENSTKKFFASIEKNEADFAHLISQYPNNRFVMRAYHRFLIELVGDHERAKEALENCRKLSRGIMISRDKAHELGLVAFSNIPTSIGANRHSSIIDPHPSEVSYNAQSENELDVDDKDQDISEFLSLKEKINFLVIPSIRKTIIIRVFILLVFFIGLFFSLLFYFTYMMNDLLSPLPILKNLAYIRQLGYSIVATSMRFIFEELGYATKTSNRTDPAPVFLGSTYDLRDQLVFLLSSIVSSLHKIGEMREYKNDFPSVVAAKKFILSPSINYTKYLNSNEKYHEMLPIQNAVQDFVIQLGNTISKPEGSLTSDVLNTSAFMNPYGNLKIIADAISSALSMFTVYMNEIDTYYRNMCQYGLVGLIILGILLYLFSLSWQIKAIESNKTEIYTCLTSLPKSTVSTISEGLRMIKNDLDKSSNTKESELSKQEENILKLFNNGSTHTSNRLSDSIAIIIGTLLILLLHFGCSILLYNLGITECNTLINSAPHIDYVSGSFSLSLGGVFHINNLAAYSTGNFIPVFTLKKISEIVRDRFKNAMEYFQLTRYGGETEQEIPFQGYSSGLQAANSKLKCKNDETITNNIEDLVDCYPVDVLYSMLLPLILHIVDEFQFNNVSISPTDPRITTIWNVFQYPVYENFFAPMFESIIPTITDQENASREGTDLIVLILLCFGILIEIITLVFILGIETHMKSTLSLLQHCPFSVILQTQKIVSVLSGNFVSGSSELLKRDSSFFESVFNGLPDAIIVADNQNSIQTSNESAKRMFSDKATNGQLLSSLISNEFFDNPEIHKLLSHDNQHTMTSVFIKSDSTKIHVSLTSSILGERIVISVRDITQTIRYNSLIQEERLKSDKILSSILPQSLVKRVQNGEKNISFSVQSASIIFIDIVEFTPWCGSLPATTVMSTLNDLFRRFDGLVALYPQLTKIKCIGDCYMAAGGIFSEINNPTEHAKQSVSFGLDALNAILDLNRELNQNLRIRVGINTGGPIVAGVLGVSKPTFEIFGPAINMAQQMEHHGVPSNVHISRSVYELIYGDVFNVKERGNVEIKGGPVLTYLVTGKQ